MYMYYIWTCTDNTQGTIPFISVELLSSSPFNHSFDRPIHNAVHDMESILWVLLYICLTREANEGGIRRHELQPNNPGKNKTLLQLICDLFEKSNATSRTTCLRVPNHFEGISIHIFTVSNLCYSSCAGFCTLLTGTKVSSTITFIASCWPFLRRLLPNSSNIEMTTRSLK